MLGRPILANPASFERSSCSSWRTRFRGDYAIGGELLYDVDADPGPPDDDDDLTGAERLELLHHRCFVRCPKPHEDRFPYDGRHAEPRP